jgi:hypothetical protein
MIRMSVRADLNAVRDQLRRLEKGVREKAIAAALNRTAEMAKTAAARDITGTFNLQARYVKDRIRIRRASARSGVLEVVLSSPGKRSANLIRYAETRPTAAKIRKRAKSGTLGVYVKIRRGDSYKLVKGAFIGNQGRTVFRRVGKARLPIESLQAIDVPQAMFSDIGVTNLKRAVARVFPQRLAYEIQRLIGR